MGDIPPPGDGCKKAHWGNYKDGSYARFRSMLAGLGIGQFVVVERRFENQAGRISKKLGIVVVCRRLGSDDTTTIYRKE